MIKGVKWPTLIYSKVVYNMLVALNASGYEKLQFKDETLMIQLCSVYLFNVGLGLLLNIGQKRGLSR